MLNEYGSTSSPLLRNTKAFREDLISRNLYTPDVQYPLENNQIAKTVSSINSIINGIVPFKSIDIENSPLGRVITNETQTPLAIIGLSMLGKQMALNAMSHVSQQTLPVIKVSNFFDGNKDTEIFEKNINFSITKKTSGSTFGNFINRMVYFNPRTHNPFTNKSTNTDYLASTGKGQLNFLYNSFNRNLYKPKDSSYINTGIKIKNELESVNKLGRLTNKNGKWVFFTFNVNKWYPYPSINYDNNFVNDANDHESYSYQRDVMDEYAPSGDYVRDYFGNTLKDGLTYKKYNSSENNTEIRNNWINNQNRPTSDQLVWGRDGIKLPAKDISYRGTLSNGDETRNQDVETNFKIKKGLLEYTRNLINATKGQVGDLTRKIFVDGDKIKGFNGSGIWVANNSKYANSTKVPNANKLGIRQHTALDQYNRFAKAIRFDGNNVYGGNPNSVIYNTVLPRIHPTNDSNSNKNLMFSLENLAVRVISKDGVGIIDDEYGSQIPACEVGPFNGRIMWFPPYAIDIQETAYAKYESTVMVGRNEPMYNYQNSERTSTVSFMMLVDYPPNVKNYKNNENPQRDISEFFLFGGDKTNNQSSVDDIQKKIKDKEKRRNTLMELAVESPVVDTLSWKYTIYFPNDVPYRNSNIYTIIDEMYNNLYEIDKNVEVKNDAYDHTTFGLNSEIYFKTGLKINATTGKYELQAPQNLQYTAIEERDEFGPYAFGNALKNTFSNEENRKYYEIYIEGGTSTLWKPRYNLKLGARRAEAAKYFVEKKLEAYFKQTAAEMKIDIITESVGETKAVATNEGNTPEGIPKRNVKMDRNATITLRRKSNAPDQKFYDDPAVKEQINALNMEIDELYKQLSRLNANSLTNCAMEERKSSNDGILYGFDSIKDNKYYPVFHSQTPEDFHRRLTFLQQCTRQGSAKIYEPEADNNGILRARNSVFGRQPICILRIGDFFYTKVIIESVNFDYTDTTWDMNPEGFGLQPMMVKITLTMKVIGGQSLTGPIDALQNAVSFNYYANSNFSKEGLYKLPSYIAEEQLGYISGINAENIERAEEDFALGRKNAKTKNIWGY